MQKKNFDPKLVSTITDNIQARWNLQIVHFRYTPVVVGVFMSIIYALTIVPLLTEDPLTLLQQRLIVEFLLSWMFCFFFADTIRSYIHSLGSQKKRLPFARKEGAPSTAFFLLVFPIFSLIIMVLPLHFLVAIGNEFPTEKVHQILKNFPVIVILHLASVSFILWELIVVYFQVYARKSQ